ncbi:hypothetical protein [Albibacterium bauzanense]|uniref:Uncharacterized protein n=1 Tax=Albibacterium bauzanense TaxID=653929 RepID=A0A4R1M0A0_9SPHI|nr:hypothetical protein [Albibacterium bauzanense]TCK85035.1 hypothetical protein C8N28_0331 [Albibacterium bauzanense]
MRSIAELPHPDCKITIFSMNQKFIIKIEQGSLEQTYKISEMDVTDGVNGVFQLIDETFINQALSHFKSMMASFKETCNRHEF